jgi:hypothetical protein
MKKYEAGSREASLLRKLEAQVTQERVTLDKWLKNAADNPYYAAERAMPFIEAAARLEVFGETVRTLTDEDSKATWDSVYAYAMRQIRQRAGHPSRSSSPSSNLLHEETASAWVRLVEMMDWS